MPIKLTQEQALALLRAVGVADAEIVSEAADFNQDETMRLIDTARKPIIRAQIEDEVRDTISKAATGRLAGTFKSALARAFGVTRDELDQYTSGKEDEMITALMAKWQAANPSKDADVQSLRQQIIDLGNTHTAKFAEQKAAFDAQLAAEKARFVGRDINDALAACIKAIPRTGGDEGMQAQMLRAHLDSKYHIEFNPDTKKIELREKDKPERPAMNETGTQILGVDQAAKAFLEGLGIAAKNMGSVNPRTAAPGAVGQHQNGVGAVSVPSFADPSNDPLAAENARVMQELGMAQ